MMREDSLRSSSLIEEAPSVEPDEFVTRVRKLMREERIHDLPVVEDGHVEGVIRQRDLLNVTSTKSNVTVGGYVESVPDISVDDGVLEAAKKMMGADLDFAPVTSDGKYAGALRLSAVFEALNYDLSGVKVRGNMTREVACCDASDPVSKVWVNMLESGFSGFPVLKAGELVGILTISDIIREGHARVKRESRTGDNAKESPKVERIMSTPVTTITPEDDLGAALERMQALEVGRLPVVNGEDIVGIVDRYDVLQAVTEVENV